jgi:hypothetical protein
MELMLDFGYSLVVSRVISLGCEISHDLSSFV